uniref:Uncharacterized protein n=1 Tax=viral metagenome TaxID=1070528 RepID=A0A6M3KMM7_9ZZZZ
MELKRLFEEWFSAQFGAKAAAMLETDSDGEYIDQTVNAIWIGFVARDALGRFGLDE